MTVTSPFSLLKPRSLTSARKLCFWPFDLIRDHPRLSLPPKREPRRRSLRGGASDLHALVLTHRIFSAPFLFLAYKGLTPEVTDRNKVCRCRGWEWRKGPTKMSRREFERRWNQTVTYHILLAAVVTQRYVFAKPPRNVC